MLCINAIYIAGLSQILNVVQIGKGAERKLQAVLQILGSGGLVS